MIVAACLYCAVCCVLRACDCCFVLVIVAACLFCDCAACCVLRACDCAACLYCFYVLVIVVAHRSQLTQMQQHRKLNEAAKKKWQNSDDRKVSVLARELCAVRAKQHEDELEGLHQLAADVHTQQDADEALSNVTADNVPAGTADGETDLTHQTQSGLHLQMKKATDSLKVDLDEMERKRRQEIARGLAVRAFKKTKSMLADVHKMEEGGFADVFTKYLTPLLCVLLTLLLQLRSEEEESG